ncbi:MAG TPA: hypothetical protein VHK91_09515 [Flavisolibacter sp.]|nr:hypothetical protein [Flavisolibacter sp.]
MKRTTLFWLLLMGLGSLGMAVSSCRQCGNVDCPPTNASELFRIVDAAGKDLVFGPGKIYDKSQVRFYNLQGSDTIFLTSQILPPSGSSTDSAFLVAFSASRNTSYVPYGNGDADTLNLDLLTLSSKCCGTSTTLNGIKFNGVSLSRVNGTYQLRK